MSTTVSPNDGGRMGRRLLRVYQNPYVGMIATGATILSLILSIYFYVHSIKKRELVYFVNPAQAVVVKTGEASQIKVLFGGDELKSDVTAAQIAIWNQGNDSIRYDNVLERVVIRTNPHVPILEASIRKKSRDIVQISLDESEIRSGALGVKWNILEQADGAVIQIVYAGPPTTLIQASGVIEGQHQIRELKDRSGATQDPKYNELAERLSRLMNWVLTGVGLLLFGFCTWGLILERDDRRFRRMMVLGSTSGLLVAASTVVIGVYFTSPSPPF